MINRTPRTRKSTGVFFAKTDAQPGALAVAQHQAFWSWSAENTRRSPHLESPCCTPIPLLPGAGSGVTTRCTSWTVDGARIAPTPRMSVLTTRRPSGPSPLVTPVAVDLRDRRRARRQSPSLSDGQFPPEALRAPGSRWSIEPWRLVVRSGPPRLLVAVLVSGFPAVVFIWLLWVGRWEPAAAPALLFFVVVAAAAWLVVQIGGAHARPSGRIGQALPWTVAHAAATDRVPRGPLLLHARGRCG